MPRYIMVYKDKDPNGMAEMPKEQIAKVMEAWGEWLGMMGKSVVDPGDAFKPGAKVVDSNGVQDANSTLSGYTIIDAKDFDQALEFAKGNPGIADGTRVEVYEAFGL